ncbi:MAG: hypothetical protein ACKN81_18665, partial [Pirellulaceae bacterium]
QRGRHRTQISPPRNTPKTRSCAATNPWCVRGAASHASPSNAVTTQLFPFASCGATAPAHTPYRLWQRPRHEDGRRNAALKFQSYNRISHPLRPNPS